MVNEKSKKFQKREYNIVNVNSRSFSRFLSGLCRFVEGEVWVGACGGDFVTWILVVTGGSCATRPTLNIKSPSIFVVLARGGDRVFIDTRIFSVVLARFGRNTLAVVHSKLPIAVHVIDRMARSHFHFNLAHVGPGTCNLRQISKNGGCW